LLDYANSIYMECQHLTCTNYSLPNILSLMWFCLLFAIFQQVSDSVIPTGFPFTTEYSLRSLHLETLATCHPSYLYNLLQIYHPSRALRSSTQQLLYVPYMSSDLGRRAFSYSCPTIWNSTSTPLTSSSAIAERPRDARVTSIRKIAKWNF